MVSYGELGDLGFAQGILDKYEALPIKIAFGITELENCELKCFT